MKKTATTRGGKRAPTRAAKTATTETTKPRESAKSRAFKEKERPKEKSKTQLLPESEELGMIIRELAFLGEFRRPFNLPESVSEKLARAQISEKGLCLEQQLEIGLTAQLQKTKLFRQTKDGDLKFIIPGQVGISFSHPDGCMLLEIIVLTLMDHFLDIARGGFNDWGMQEKNGKTRLSPYPDKRKDVTTDLIKEWNTLLVGTILNALESHMVKRPGSRLLTKHMGLKAIAHVLSGVGLELGAVMDVYDRIRRRLDPGKRTWR
jgi:hypothetical protein